MSNILIYDTPIAAVIALMGDLMEGSLRIVTLFVSCSRLGDRAYCVFVVVMDIVIGADE